MDLTFQLVQAAVKTADGQLSIKIINARSGSNAVLSDIMWIEK
jgi:hypothetical protein